MRPSLSGLLVAPLASAWHHRDLIRVILRRELQVRFAGALYQWLWPIAGPLIGLAAFTLVFSELFKVPFSSAEARTPYVLIVFSGLVLFNLFAEIAYRAPLLLHEYVHYIRTSVFPSDALCWIAVFRALFYAAISFVLLLAFQVALDGPPAWTALLLPAVLIPFLLFLVGLCWFLAAIGAYFRDIAYFMATIVPLLMFVMPVFYPPSDMPALLRSINYGNPLAAAIDMSRELLLFGTLPDAWRYGLLMLISILVFRLGHAFFERYRSVIVDVI